MRGKKASQTNPYRELQAKQNQAPGGNTALESTVVRFGNWTRYARPHKVDSCRNPAYACFCIFWSLKGIVWLAFSA